MQRPTRDELLYLADQEQHERSMMRQDNYDDKRASLVKEWALREAAALCLTQQLKEPSQ